jgi:hypothetical protein
MKSFSYTEGLVILLEHIDQVKKSASLCLSRGQGVSQPAGQKARKEHVVALESGVGPVQGARLGLVPSQATAAPVSLCGTWEVSGALPLGRKNQNSLYQSLHI